MEHHVYFWMKGERKNEADLATFEESSEAERTITGRLKAGMLARMCPSTS